MFQLKAPNGSDVHAKGTHGEVWLSPSRDLFHNYIPFLEKAVVFVNRLKEQDPYLKRMFYEDKVVSMQAFYDTVDSINKIIQDIAAPDKTDSIKAICKARAFDKLDHGALSVLSYAFMCVTMSAYCHYCNEAKAGTYKPFLYGSPESLQAVTDSDTRYFAGIRDRLKYWVNRLM
jgi:hypothetical protein